MTQPCHKDTTLNQQHCNSKHKSGRAGEQDKTPPHFPTHNKHDTTRQKRNGNDTRGTGNVEGSRAMQGARPSPNTGAAQHTPPPPFNGTTMQMEGGHHTQDGDANSIAALHPPCHPPSATPPALPRWPHPPPRRGGSGQRIPHHTNSTDTHSPAPHHSTWQGTLCDMTAVLASTAVR